MNEKMPTAEQMRVRYEQQLKRHRVRLDNAIQTMYRRWVGVLETQLGEIFRGSAPVDSATVFVNQIVADFADMEAIVLAADRTVSHFVRLGYGAGKVSAQDLLRPGNIGVRVSWVTKD